MIRPYCDLSRFALKLLVSVSIRSREQLREWKQELISRLDSRTLRLVKQTVRSDYTVIRVSVNGANRKSNSNRKTQYLQK